MFSLDGSMIRFYVYQITIEQSSGTKFEEKKQLIETSKRVWLRGEVIGFKIKMAAAQILGRRKISYFGWNFKTKNPKSGEIGQNWYGLTRLAQKERGQEKLDYNDNFAVFKTGLAQFWKSLEESSNWKNLLNFVAFKISFR